MRNIFRMIILLSFLFFASNAFSETFWKTGKIKVVWTDQVAFSGCLVMLDNPIDNGCPANGYISLDCMGLVFGNVENANRMYSAATAAMHADKTVSLYVDNTKKVNGYCAARVIRVFK